MPRRPAAASDRPATLLRERTAAPFRHLPKALAGDADAVHQMRVTGRRLRVALPILADKPEGRRVRRTLRLLRRLTKAAGQSRDLDVSVDLLGEDAGSRTRERATLRRRLRATRARSRRGMAEALLDLEIAKLRRDLRSIVSRGAAPIFAVLVRLRERREVEGAAILSALDALGDRFDAEELHGLRIRVRRLRYVAELSEALRGRPAAAAGQIKELQELLGRIHDAHVLARWLGVEAESARRRGAAALAKAAAGQAAAFRDVSMAAHRALLAADPRALVTRALEEMRQSRTAA